MPHTHSPATHTGYTHRLHTLATHTGYTHWLHTPATHTGYTHRLHTPATHTGYTHWLHTPATHTGYTHRLHTPATHTLATHTGYTHWLHTHLITRLEPHFSISLHSPRMSLKLLHTNMVAVWCFPGGIRSHDKNSPYLYLWSVWCRLYVEHV